jgi:hypothetical protein
MQDLADLTHLIQSLRAELQTEKKLRLALEAQVRLIERRLTRTEGAPPVSSLDSRLFRVECWVREVTAGLPATYDGRTWNPATTVAEPGAAPALKGLRRGAGSRSKVRNKTRKAAGAQSRSSSKARGVR